MQQHTKKTDYHTTLNVRQCEQKQWQGSSMKERRQTKTRVSAGLTDHHLLVIVPRINRAVVTWIADKGNLAICRYSDMAIWRYGDMAIW